MVDPDATYTGRVLRLAWHVWALAYAAFAFLFAWFAVHGMDGGARATVMVAAALFACVAVLSIPVVRAFHPAQLLFSALALAAALALL